MRTLKFGPSAFVWTLVLGMLALPLDAQSRTVGNISIGPSNSAWTARPGERGGLVYELAIDAGARHCTVAIDAGAIGTGDAAADFSVRWKALIGQQAALPATKRGTHAAGFVSMFGESTGPNLVGEYRTLALLSLTKGKRTQSVAAMADDERRLVPLKALLKTVALVDGAVEGGRAASSGSALPARPAAIDAAPSTGTQAPPRTVSNNNEVDALLGLWHGVKTIPLLTYGSSAAVARYLLFFAHGTYIAALPDHGIDAASIAALSKYERGDYRVANGVVSLYQAAPGHGTPQTFVMEKGMLKDSYGYLMHRASTDGVKLSGTSSFEPSEAGRLGIPRDATLTFGEGGRFSDHAALNWIARLKNSTTPRSAGGDGRYEAANFAMTFRYDDGRVVRWTLYFAGPRDISLGETRLENRP